MGLELRRKTYRYLVANMKEIVQTITVAETSLKKHENLGETKS